MINTNSFSQSDHTASYNNFTAVCCDLTYTIRFTNRRRHGRQISSINISKFPCSLSTCNLAADSCKIAVSLHMSSEILVVIIRRNRHHLSSRTCASPNCSYMGTFCYVIKDLSDFGVLHKIHTGFDGRLFHVWKIRYHSILQIQYNLKRIFAVLHLNCTEIQSDE